MNTPINTNSISYTGRMDGGAWGRAISIARSLANAGKWDGQEEIIIHNPYDTELVVVRLEWDNKTAAELVEGTHYELPNHKATDTKEGGNAPSHTYATNTGRRYMTTKQSVKLSEAQESVIQCIIETKGRSAGNNPSTHTIKSLCNNHKMVNWAKVGEKWTLTDAGREYAQSKGWLASEAATVEAERESVENPLEGLTRRHQIADKYCRLATFKVSNPNYNTKDLSLDYMRSEIVRMSKLPDLWETQEAQLAAPEPTQAGEGFMRPCEHCKGVGSKLDAYDGYSRPCEYCDGTGIHDGTRIPLDMIPDAHFTDVAQLATYANERRHSVTGDLECVECKGNGGFNAWMGWRQCKICNGAGYLPTTNVHAESTPLSVLHEAIKALNGVNDPALRTRDCVERTERALGLLVDELLPMVGQLQSDLALFVGVFNKLSKRVRRDNVGLGEAWEYTITISDVRHLTLETAAKEVERKLESKGG